MTERLYTVAAAPFEAARQVDILPAGHRARRLHGHGFLARVRAEPPPEWAPFRDGETDALAERLRAVVAPLDYALLNDYNPTGRRCPGSRSTRPPPPAVITTGGMTESGRS